MTPQGIPAPLSSSYSFLPPYLLTLPFFHLLLLPVLTSPAFPPSTSPFCRYFVEEEANRKEREGDGTILKVSVSCHRPHHRHLLFLQARADRQETEQFYLQKFREYILNSNR